MTRKIPQRNPQNLPETPGTPPGKIWFYKATNAWYCFANFSNFSVSTSLPIINISGSQISVSDDPNGTILYWKTTEHLLQALKFLKTKQGAANYQIIEEIRNCQSARDTFNLANSKNGTYKNLIDHVWWSKVNLALSDWFLLKKIEQNPKLREILEDSGDDEIVEHTSNDKFWGDGGNGLGENQLGKSWMRIRAKILSSQSSFDSSHSGINTNPCIICKFVNMPGGNEEESSNGRENFTKNNFSLCSEKCYDVLKYGNKNYSPPFNRRVILSHPNWNREEGWKSNNSSQPSSSSSQPSSSSSQPSSSSSQPSSSSSSSSSIATTNFPKNNSSIFPITISVSLFALILLIGLMIIIRRKKSKNKLK